MKYVCNVCGWVYDEASGEGTKWADLPDDFKCPKCHVGKDKFSKLSEDK